MNIGWKVPSDNLGLTSTESRLKSRSTDREILRGEDDEKEEDKNEKSEETNHLCLFNLWEGHEDPLPSLFACQD